MEYHEIGERFEYDGVMLEVIKAVNCNGCFFNRSGCELKSIPMYCGSRTRDDKESIIYKLVKQCKPKDVEQKTEIKIKSTDNTFAIQVDKPQSDEEIYGSLLDKLFTAYKAKNHDSSNFFSEMYDELGIDYAYGKLREKMNCIKLLRKHPNMIDNEELEDALLDMAGCVILTLVELKKRKDNEDTK